MRRVLFLCLVPLACALSSAHAQQTPLLPRVLDPLTIPRTNAYPGVPPVPSTQQQQQVPAPWYCAASAPIPGTPFPTLTQVPRTDSYLEYAGTPLTWTPIDNSTECHIRQIYFSIPDNFVMAPNGAYPDMFVQLVLPGTTTPVKAPMSYDIVPMKIYNGLVTFRVDAQSPKNLYGNFDLYVSIVGTPKPSPAKK